MGITNESISRFESYKMYDPTSNTAASRSLDKPITFDSDPVVEFFPSSRLKKITQGIRPTTASHQSGNYMRTANILNTNQIKSIVSKRATDIKKIHNLSKTIKGSTMSSRDF